MAMGKLVAQLSSPLLPQDSFYKSLSTEQHKAAFRNEYDFDSPDAIDFDVLIQSLHDIKHGRKAEIPVYSFEKHQRLTATTTIYSARVVILEGIFALYHPGVKSLLDIKWTAVVRDVRDRGRDIEGVIKQWFTFVKPNFERDVNPQKKLADMIVRHVQQILKEKSKRHTAELKKLGEQVEDERLSLDVVLLDQTPQVMGMSTIIQDAESEQEDFLFYSDRLASLLIERAPPSMEHVQQEKSVVVPRVHEVSYIDLDKVSAVVVLRAGSALENGLKRVLPDCRTGRMLIQTNYRTAEPELHFLKLPAGISTHDAVLLLDSQMSSGGAALMAVSVLIDHGVLEDRIVFVTYFAGRMGLKRLCKVFPKVRVVLGRLVEDFEDRWFEKRYFGC
ncbi:MAG: Uridine kinase [Phylliscum demangeonii]|nr:MAG: Uridine kinase [Phylliscum demangeonii]